TTINDTINIEFYLYTDQSNYYQGEIVNVHLYINNNTRDLVVDIYLAIVNPQSKILFYPSWGDKPLPIISNFSMPDNLFYDDLQILSLQVGGENSPVSEPGDYIVVIGFTSPGTFDFFEGTSLGLFYFSVKPELSCPDDMVRIPPTGSEVSFTLGDEWGDGDVDETGTQKITLRAYCMDKYEFPNIIGEYPYNFIDWYDSSAECINKGKRLCTEAEWENACKGPEGYKYPYGNTFNSENCNSGYAGKPETSGSRPYCASGYGVFDMSGNFQEWVGYRDADWYKSYPGAQVSFNFSGYYRVVRGGDFLAGSSNSRCPSRGGSYQNRIYYSLSFRCCKQ
ncbi:formylglycine-generating enzyme family protein, partial [bacterium]|nr:formylglycine-generating enzyme family protein [bacterium]